MALEQQVYVFLLVTTSITREIPAETEFRNSAKTTCVHNSICGSTNVLSGTYGEFQPTPVNKFALFTSLFSVWGGLVTLWLADFFTRLAAFDRAFEHCQPIQPSTVPSAASEEKKKVRPKGE